MAEAKKNITPAENWTSAVQSVFSQVYLSCLQPVRYLITGVTPCTHVNHYIIRNCGAERRLH